MQFRLPTFNVLSKSKLLVLPELVELHPLSLLPSRFGRFCLVDCSGFVVISDFLRRRRCRRRRRRCRDGRSLARFDERYSMRHFQATLVRT